MQREKAIFAIGLLTIFASGCTSTRCYQVLYPNIAGPVPLSAHVLPGNWSLDSLLPDEKTILIDGQTVPVTITMTANGDGHYLLRLSVNGKHFRPFLLKMAEGLGEVDFSGTITWFPKARGNVEHVIMELYRLTESDQGRTAVKTLLKQVSRTYDVNCETKQWRIVLFFKKHLGLCHCTVQTIKKPTS